MAAPKESFIHKLENGPYMGYVRGSLVGLLILGLVMVYNWRGYHNLNIQEAMDSAQVARNLSEGHGYSTLFIRPFSLYLVKNHNEKVPPPGTNTDIYEIKEGMHPDLANPPMYPTVLAGWMKVYPVLLKVADTVRRFTPILGGRIPKFDDQDTNQLWASNGHFGVAAKDFLIAALNEGLFLLVAVMTYFLARRLFDLNVARLSALSLLGCELLWRFSVSGLSTLLLLTIFMVLVWSLVRLEEEFREPRLSLRGMLLLTLVPGLMLGAGTLTTYSFGCLLAPVLAFIIAYSGRRWVTMSIITLILFSMLVGPWIYRNYRVSGTMLGTRGYTAVDGIAFTGHRLERSLQPEFKGNYSRAVLYKLRNNTRRILEEELPALGGSWVMPFFVVGLMLRFRKPAINRMRHFLIWSMVVLVIAQAMSRTQLADDSAPLNTENLLVLLTPLVLVYGVSLFFILLDQMELALPKLRFVVIGGFWIVVSLPLISVCLGWKPAPAPFPPYSPVAIRLATDMMKTNELMMSDIPWAVAWYGQRQCALLTLGADDDFYALNDYVKPVRALYLTQVTTDFRLYTDWITGAERSWSTFVANTLINKVPPKGFPLRYPMPDFVNGQILLMDRERWKDELPSMSTTNKPALKP